MAAEIKKRFDYHPPSTEPVKLTHEQVRKICAQAARELCDLTPEGREQSLMLTKLEEAMFWANAAVAREQHEGVPF